MKKINKVDATTGELIESPVNPDPIKELLDIKMESVDASAKIAMRGMAPYKGWTEVGADGLTRIGKIVIWSYADLENQNKMSRPPSSRSENGSFAPQSGESKLVNTKDDF